MTPTSPYFIYGNLSATQTRFHFSPFPFLGDRNSTVSTSFPMEKPSFTIKIWNTHLLERKNSNFTAFLIFKMKSIPEFMGSRFNRVSQLSSGEDWLRYEIWDAWPLLMNLKPLTSFRVSYAWKSSSNFYFLFLSLPEVLLSTWLTPFKFLGNRISTVSTNFPAEKTGFTKKSVTPLYWRFLDSKFNPVL